jgi:hypothetical protein
VDLRGLVNKIKYGIPETHSENQGSNLENVRLVRVVSPFCLGFVGRGASELVEDGLNDHKYDTRERHCWDDV